MNEHAKLPVEGLQKLIWCGKLKSIKYSVHIRPVFCLIQQYQSTLTIFILLLLSSANNITCIFQIVFVGGNASGEQKQTCSITAVQIGQTVFFPFLDLAEETGIT